MKTKLITVLLMITLLSVSTVYGQSFFRENTMTIFKGDVDKLMDVNDYAEVDINKVYIAAGARLDDKGSPVRDVRGGFAINTEKLHFGLFYSGNFWSGHGNTTLIGSNRADTADIGMVLDNHFLIMLGNENIGGIGINFALHQLRIDEDVNGGNTNKYGAGSIDIGAVWGKNFGVGEGTLKPELGFMVEINMEKWEDNSGNKNNKDHSSLAFILTAEYLFPREGNHQTTLSFGDYPVFILPYTNDGPPSNKHDGSFYNTLFGELKQVYDLSGSLSLGYLVGLSLAMNLPGDNYFHFGFLPRISCGLAYKVNEKFTFNTGVRLGSLEPEIVHPGNMDDSFGFFYTSYKPSGSEYKNYYFLPFTGAWGIGLLWKPEEIFSADFSVDSKLSAGGGSNFNFNVLFTLSL